MIIEINNNKLEGSLDAIASKSYAQRAIFAAIIAKGASKIEINSLSNDIKVALQIAEDLGASLEEEGDNYMITPPNEFPDEIKLNVGESGTSLRFLIPIVAALGVKATIKREGSLVNRTNKVYKELLPLHGVEYYEDGESILVNGKLKPGKYNMAANISSQFISGMILALSYLGDESTIVLTTELESKDYVKMTIDLLKLFGVKITVDENVYTVKERPHGSAYKVEGDWSNALFFLAAGVEVKGLNKNTSQGDIKALDYLKELGYQNVSDNEYLLKKLEKAANKRVIDAKNMPDAVPILAIMSALEAGLTEVVNVERLRLKESDRVKTTIESLKALGVKVFESSNSFKFEGINAFKGNRAKGYNDHRIVMALAIAAGYANDKIIIDGAQAVNKSYPEFFEDMKKVGGKWQIL